MAEQYWNILIVDDDEDVHSVTQLALSDFSYEGRELEFHHAYSAAEARKMLQERVEYAVVLLDVVMETDDAGLRLCEYIRDELHNRKVRILLRTGNPGQAPEHEVIMRYEINDYIEKTSLTMGKFINHMVVALRSYRDLCALEGARNGSCDMVNAAAELDGTKVPDSFVRGALQQLSALLYLDNHPHTPHMFALGRVAQSGFELMATMTVADDDTQRQLPEERLAVMEEVARTGQGTSSNGYYIAQSKMPSGRVYFLYLDTGEHKLLKEEDQDLIELFCTRLARFSERGNTKPGA